MTLMLLQVMMPLYIQIVPSFWNILSYYISRFSNYSCPSLYAKYWASQVVLEVKNLPASAGDGRGMSLILESGRSPGGRNAKLPQYSCLENPMDRGAWDATLHRVEELDIIKVTSSMHVHICKVFVRRPPSYQNLWMCNPLYKVIQSMHIMYAHPFMYLEASLDYL